MSFQNSILLICLILALVLGACNTAPAPTVTNERATGENVRQNTNAPNAASSPASTGASQNQMMAGDPVDTSRQDAEIRRLEREVSSSGQNREESRRQLAAAYLERAVMLTSVRQYRAALGDYRRTLQYDADNREAREMVVQISNIIRGYGREVPAPGTEPTPLPFSH